MTPTDDDGITAEQIARLERFKTCLDARRLALQYKGFSALMLCFAGVLSLNIGGHIPHARYRALAVGAGIGLIVYGVVRETWATWRMVRETQASLAQSRAELSAINAKLHAGIMAYRNDRDQAKLWD